MPETIRVAEPPGKAENPAPTSWHGTSIGKRQWQTSKIQLRDERAMANEVAAAYLVRHKQLPSR
jgi:hypothetical protein